MSSTFLQNALVSCRNFNDDIGMEQRMEWIDRLDKASAFIDSKKSKKGWVLKDLPNRTDSLWEVTRWGSVKTILAEMDEFTGRITLKVLEVKPK